MFCIIFIVRKFRTTDKRLPIQSKLSGRRSIVVVEYIVQGVGVVFIQPWLATGHAIQKQQNQSFFVYILKVSQVHRLTYFHTLRGSKLMILLYFLSDYIKGW